MAVKMDEIMLWLIACVVSKTVSDLFVSLTLLWVVLAANWHSWCSLYVLLEWLKMLCYRWVKWYDSYFVWCWHSWRRSIQDWYQVISIISVSLFVTVCKHWTSFVYCLLTLAAYTLSHVLPTTLHACPWANHTVLCTVGPICHLRGL